MAANMQALQMTPPNLPRPKAPDMPSFTQQNDSVEKRLSGLMKTDSNYMTQAATAGLQAGNRRGLLNSTMAIGAAQDSAARAALPIAQQDAQQAFAKNMSRQDFDQSRNLQQNDIQSREYMQGRDIGNSQFMQGRDISFRGEQAGLDRQQQTAMQERDIGFRSSEAGLDRDQQRFLQGREIEANSAERSLDRSLQERLASMNLSSSDRNAAAELLRSMELAFSEDYRSLMSNPSLDQAARSSQIQSMMRLRDTRLDFIQQMYQVKLEWPQST